jgi:ribosomal protein S18 acetylase RimI-like enzyme
MIIPSFRRKGIGAEVVARVEKEMAAHGRIRAIKAGVQVNNPDAIKFWQRLGYKITGGPELRPDKTTVYHIRKDIAEDKKHG